MQNFGQNLEKKPGWNSLLAKMGYSSSKLAMGRIPYCATASIRLACWLSLLIKIWWLLIINARTQHTTNDFWGGDDGSKIAERVNVLNALFFRAQGKGWAERSLSQTYGRILPEEFGLQHFLHTHIRIMKCFRKHFRDTHQ